MYVNENSLSLFQAILSPPVSLSCFSCPPSPVLNAITNFISCAPGSLISPPHNDSGPHSTFHLRSHTIKARKIAWQPLTNHRDEQGLEMFFLRGILHPADLQVIVVSVFVSVTSVLKKHLNVLPVRGPSWIISLLECLLMACKPFFISAACDVPLSGGSPGSIETSLSTGTPGLVEDAERPGDQVNSSSQSAKTPHLIGLTGA